MINSEDGWHEAVVMAPHEGWRLDRWLHLQLREAWGEGQEEYSRSQIQKGIRGCCEVNERSARASTVLRRGDRVRCDLSVLLKDKKVSTQIWQPKPCDFDLLWEDEDLLMVHKPAGVLSHPGAGRHGPTLIEGVMHYLGTRGGDAQKHPLRFGLVHRLDKDTSGVMAIAKTKQAHGSLSEQFALKTATREYVALLDGTLPQHKLSYESYLYRSPRCRIRFASMDLDQARTRWGPQRPPSSHRYSASTFVVQVRFAQRFDLCTVVLKTGRTHQIRVHSHTLQAPVLGDALYKKQGADHTFFDQSTAPPPQRQMLHARKLQLMHPVSKQTITAISPLTADFKQLLHALLPYKDVSF